MTVISRHALYWTPRVLCIGFAIFLSMFALDVFNEGYNFWQTILALLIHLMPTAVLLAVLAVAWRWEWVGAVLFTAAGITYSLMARGHPDWILTIAGPLFVIAALFLFNWLKRAELHTPRKHRPA